MLISDTLEEAVDIIVSHNSAEKKLDTVEKLVSCFQKKLILAGNY